jgi:PEGA domain
MVSIFVMLFLSAGPTSDVEAAAPSASAAVFLSKVDAKTQVEFERLLGEEKVVLPDIGQRFPTTPPGTEGSALAKAAAEAYENLDYELAVKKVEEALEYLNAHPLEAEPVLVAQVHFLNAVLAVQNGGKTGAPKAAEQFAKALVQNPAQTLDANVFGNDLKKIFEKSKSEFAEATKVKLEIKTTPSDAQVFLNGQRAFSNELEVQGGRLQLVASKPGYETWAERIDVNAANRSIEVTLRKLPAFAAVEDAGDVLASGLVKPMPQTAKVLAKSLNVRFLILGRRAPMGTEVELWDTQTGNQVRSLSFNDASSMRACAAKLKNFMEHPSVLKPMNETVAAAPVYKKWWFWAGVGALAVGGGVAAGVVAANGANRPFDVVLGTP